jgi:hypothetical protein
VARIAWYKGTEHEARLQHFGEWLSQSTKNSTTISSYIANAAAALHRGVRDLDDIWQFDLSHGARATMATAWKKYQAFLLETAESDLPIAKGYEKHAQEFYDYIREHRPELVERTAAAYRKTVERLIASYVGNTPEGWRKVFEMLPPEDRKKLPAVWPLFMKWFNSVSTEPLADPWYWPWTVDALYAFRQMRQIPLPPADLAKLRWDDFQFFKVPANYQSGDRYSIHNSLGREIAFIIVPTYEKWKKIAQPRSAEDPLFPEYPGGRESASPRYLIQLEAAADHMLQEQAKARIAAREKQARENPPDPVMMRMGGLQPIEASKQAQVIKTVQEVRELSPVVSNGERLVMLPGGIPLPPGVTAYAYDESAKFADMPGDENE